MNIIGIVQLKNEKENIKALLEQARVMSDGIIIVDDNSTDNTFTPEILNDPIILEYVKLPEKEMFEGINLSVLINLARKHGATWCYNPMGHYRYRGNINDFKEQIKLLDSEGITHVNLRWFTMWNSNQYRVDGKYDVSKRWHCNIFKLQPDTWFKVEKSHCVHPESNIEVHYFMSDIFEVNYGRNDKVKRQKKFDLYNKVGDGKETFDHYLDKDVVLVDYDKKKMSELVYKYNENINIHLRFKGKYFVLLK